MDDLNTNDWNGLSITDTPFGGALYHSTTGSHEIVVDRGSVTIPGFYRSGQKITLPSSGEEVTITTWYDGPGSGSYVWLWIE